MVGHNMPWQLQLTCPSCPTWVRGILIYYLVVHQENTTSYSIVLVLLVSAMHEYSTMLVQYSTAQPRLVSTVPEPSRIQFRYAHRFHLIY